jgi:hypothetical protein
MTEQDLKDAIERGIYVMHSSGVIGKPVKYFEAGAYPTERGPISNPVVELHNGHAFVAMPAAFQPLDEHDARFVQGCRVLAQTCINGMLSLGKQSLTMSRAVSLILHVLGDAVVTLREGQSNESS